VQSPPGPETRCVTARALCSDASPFSAVYHSHRFRSTGAMDDAYARLMSETVNTAELAKNLSDELFTVLGWQTPGPADHKSRTDTDIPEKTPVVNPPAGSSGSEF